MTTYEHAKLIKYAWRHYLATGQRQYVWTSYDAKVRALSTYLARIMGQVQRDSRMPMDLHIDITELKPLT